MSASECTTTAAATATPAAPSTPAVSAPGASTVAHDSPWRTPLELMLLGAIWGGSFLFMRVAAADFGAFPLVEARLGLGALVLLPFLWAARAQFTPALWLRIAGIAAINSVIPFALFAWGAERAPAGIGAITNAMTVMFTALVAFLFFGERIGERRLILGERAAARRAVHGGRVRVLLSSHRARRRAAHLDRDLPDPALRRDLGVADSRRAAHAHDGTRRRADPRGRGAESKPRQALTRWWADVRSGADARSRTAASLPRSAERARARRLPDDRRR